MDSHEREGLLPVRLFRDGDVLSKDFKNYQQHNHGFMVSPKGLRTCKLISVSCGSSYSSGSDFSSPFGSELETTSASETTESEEDEEFISELTRQMAEYMLQDDDDGEDEEEVKQFQHQDQDNNDHTAVSSVSSCLPDSNSEASELPVNWSDCKSSCVCYYYSSPEFPSPSESAVNADTDEQLRPVEVYDLKNQPQLNNKQDCGVVVGGYGGERVDKAANESTHQPLQQHQAQKEQQNRVGVSDGDGKAWKQQGKKNNNIPILPTPKVGSGMRAVFLGGSQKTGTGVFLPTGASAKPEPKSKSVLIPARVLQTLQQHFNTVGTMSPSKAAGGGSTDNLHWRNDVLARINGLLSQNKEHAEFQTRLPQQPAYSAPETSYHPEVSQLPQEWTY